MMLSRIGEIIILLKQHTLRGVEDPVSCAMGAGVWPEFGSLRILVTAKLAFLCVLCVSNESGSIQDEWVVNRWVTGFVEFIGSVGSSR